MQLQLPFSTSESTDDVQGKSGPKLSIAGLFAGIGGIELGLHQAGHETRLLCEIDNAATAVLSKQFGPVEHVPDITTLRRLPRVDLVSAGFPCQDLSIAGKREGISGRQSSLVSEVFRLLDTSEIMPRWLLLENVPFMLRLQNGRAMTLLLDELEQRGFAWAYRVVDTRSFGLPHRRQRLLLLASQREDPTSVLLSSARSVPSVDELESEAFGFYWTEGNRGVGWSPECVPPIKVGSGLGIPSPPAVWDIRSQSIFKLDIRDGERLQGFPEDWTQPAEVAGKSNERWKLVGNSVSVPLGQWIGSQLRVASPYNCKNDVPLESNCRLPEAAWGDQSGRFVSTASMWPVSTKIPRLNEFLKYPGEALSSRAAAGLLKRITNGSTNVPHSFLEILESIAQGERIRLAESACRKLEQELDRLRRDIERETRFAKQVKLNERLRLQRNNLSAALVNLRRLKESP